MLLGGFGFENPEGVFLRDGASLDEYSHNVPIKKDKDSVWPFALSELTGKDGLAKFHNIMFTSAVPNKCYYLMFFVLFDQELFAKAPEQAGPFSNTYNRY